METLKGLFIRVQEFAAEINKIKISTKKASEIKVLLDKLQTLKDECLVEISKGDHAITEPKLRGEFSELMGKLLHILTITKSDLWEEFHRKLDQATRQKDTPSSDDDGEDVPPEEKPPSTSKNTLPAHQESERVIIVEKDSERVASLENQTNERQIAPKNKPIVELKLDRLELPYFSGNLLEWIAFRDQFIDLAHNNSNLTTMIKFHLLRTHLKGAALETVAGYQFTASNYLAAWEDLLNRYDRTDSIIEEYIRRFVELPLLTNGSNGQKYTHMINVTNQMLRALPNWGINVQSWDAWVKFMLSAKMDDSTRKQWKQEIKRKQKVPLKDMMEFLETRALETQSSQGERFRNSMNHQDRKRNDARVFHVQESGKCPNCNQDHPIYRCPKMLAIPAKQRLEIIRDLKLCVKCLRSHGKDECKFKECAHCGKPHNHLLCFKKENEINQTQKETI